ncbi:DUF3265 domain-containing protein [Vibrio navarrensis]|nr:DUF3265 domain-containing protein [Vibrio navarrensis]
MAFLVCGDFGGEAVCGKLIYAALTP